MHRLSQRFDRELFTLKYSELARQMQTKSAASDRDAARKARQSGNSAAHLPNIVYGQLALLHEWLEGLDRICREVWQTQGETVSPEFVRTILAPEAMSLIDARHGVVKHTVSLVATRTGKSAPAQLLGHLTKEVQKLKSEVSTRYEIEARGLDYGTVRRDIALASFAQNSDETAQAASKPAVQPGPVADPPKKRGPKVNMNLHIAVARIVGQYGTNWKEQSILDEIARQLDEAKVPASPAWAKRNQPARSWERAVSRYPNLVVKAIEYSLKMAARVSMQ